MLTDHLLCARRHTKPISRIISFLLEATHRGGNHVIPSHSADLPCVSLGDIAVNKIDVFPRGPLCIFLVRADFLAQMGVQGGAG